MVKLYLTMLTLTTLADFHVGHHTFMYTNLKYYEKDVL